RAYRELPRMIAEAALDRYGLGEVAQRRRGSVSVDVVYVLTIETGVAQRVFHATGGPFSVLLWRGHVVGVTAHSVTGELGVNLRAAPPRVLEFLEHHHSGPLSQNESVAIPGPGTARRRRIVVAGRQRARRGEAAHREQRDGRLGAAGDHHVAVAVLDETSGFPDAVRGGRASRHHRQIRTLQSVHDRQISGDHVDDRAGYEERRNLARAAFQHVVMGPFDHRQAADARADVDADARGVRLGDLDAGVFQRLHPGCDTEMDETIHAARLFRRQVRGDVEVLDFPCDPAGEQTRVEVGDAGDAGFGRKGARPGFGNCVADRADNS